MHYCGVWAACTSGPAAVYPQGKLMDLAREHIGLRAGGTAQVRKMLYLR